jgi:hypothetical protein
MVFSVVLAAILRDAAKTPLLRMTSEIASQLVAWVEPFETHRFQRRI